MSSTSATSKFGVLAPPIISRVFTVLAAGLAFWGNQAKAEAQKAKEEAKAAAQTIQVPIGTIVAFSGGKEDLPSGWLLCDGDTIPATGYEKLNKILKSRFGGEGKLPDLQSRSPISAGKGRGLKGRELGQLIGKEENVVPEHNHGVNLKVNQNNYGLTNHPDRGFPNQVILINNSSETSTIPWVEGTKPEGVNDSDGNIQPSLVVNFIIKAE